MKKKWSFWIALVLLISLALAGCSSSDSPNADGGAASPGETSPASSSPQSGGMLRIAYGSLPQTLDPHTTTANATTHPARQIYEPLVALNSQYEVVPVLAESYVISDDRKTVTFKLRQGVKFHNGKEMKAEDVIASMEKWQQGSTAKANLGDSTWVASDDYTVILNVETPSYVLMYALAEMQQFPAIMPKEIVEAADASGVTEFVGTGPYKFAELVPNQYLRLTRFEDYEPLQTPPDGLTGKKEALLDDLYFYYVPDPSTQINGLLSGEYDFVPQVSLDALPQINGNPDVTQILYPFGLQTLVFNKKEGLFSNEKARQAVNAALDKNAIMTSSFTGPDYYRLDPGLMLEEQTAWYTDAGKEDYGKHDTALARQLLEEAGYDGKEVRIITTRDYSTLYNSAVAAQQQLQEIGMNAVLDVMDWSTLLDRRTKPDQWDMFFTGFPAGGTPLNFPFLDSKTNWPGWTNSSELDMLIGEIKAAANQDEAKSAFAELQAQFWKENPVLVLGHYLQVTATSSQVQGFKDFNGPLFWNTYLVK